MNRLNAIGIIPARYNSTRLPGKPLELLGDKTIIQRVAEQASKASRLSAVFVATDDARIAAAVEDSGFGVIMTPADLQSGTDRAASAVAAMDVDIVVNIQGDEPFIHPSAIDAVVGLLEQFPDADMGTLVRPIDDIDILLSQQTVKVVLARDGTALYFSRSPIPFNRDSEPEAWLSKGIYLQHIGLYSYRKQFLQRFSRWEITPLENSEKLEQLRALEMGARIQVAETETRALGIDTVEDLEKAREIVRQESNSH